MQVPHSTVNASAPCFERPPLIIWGDKHNSPVNCESIHDSLIFLQSIMGCNHFAMEYDSKVDLQSIIARTAKSLQNSLGYKSIVDSNNLNTYPSHLHRAIERGAEMGSALKSRLALFNEVGRMGLAYKGVDMDLGSNRSNLGEGHLDYTHAGEKFAERNNTIVKNTIELASDLATSGILLLVGLRHFIALSEAFRDNQEITSRCTVLFLYVCHETDPDRINIESKKQELESSCQFKFNMVLYGENSQSEIRNFLETYSKYRPVAIKNLVI